MENESLGKFSRMGLAQTCRPQFLSRLESQGFGCNWFGFDQRCRGEEPGTVLFIILWVHIFHSCESHREACLLKTGSIDRNNGLVNRNTELTRKQLTSEVENPGRITDSPRTFYIIILHCEIIIDNPILHSIPLTRRDVGNINRFVKDAKRKL